MNMWATGDRGKAGIVAVLVLGILLLFPAAAFCADQGGAAGQAADAARQPAPPTRPANAKAERELAYLRSIDYKTPQGQGTLTDNPNKLLRALDILIENGYLQEADEQIARMASEPFTDAQQRKLGPGLMNFSVRLMERAGPLLENGVYEFYFNDMHGATMSISNAYVRFINAQDMVDDKLRAVHFFRSVFFPFLRKEGRAAEFKEPQNFLVQHASTDGRAQGIALTHPALPDFSDAPAANRDKQGKYLLVRKLENSDMDAEYYVDFALMSALPPEYLPVSLSEVTRIITLDCTWSERGKFNNDIPCLVPAVAIKAHDAAGGELVGKVGDYQKSVPHFVHFMGDAPEKYYVRVEKTTDLEKITAWLASKPQKSKAEAKTDGKKAGAAKKK